MASILGPARRHHRPVRWRFPARPHRLACPTAMAGAACGASALAVARPVGRTGHRQVHHAEGGSRPRSVAPRARVEPCLIYVDLRAFSSEDASLPRGYSKARSSSPGRTAVRTCSFISTASMKRCSASTRSPICSPRSCRASRPTACRSASPAALRYGRPNTLGVALNGIWGEAAATFELAPLRRRDVFTALDAHGIADRRLHAGAVRCPSGSLRHQAAHAQDAARDLSAAGRPPQQQHRSLQARMPRALRGTKQKPARFGPPRKSQRGSAHAPCRTDRRGDDPRQPLCRLDRAGG